MTADKKLHVVVIGGGISGLTAAYRLRQSLGADATISLVDASDELGGKLKTVELAGQQVDVGAESFLARRPEAINLITEIGLGAEIVHPGTMRPLVRAGGRSVYLPAATMMGIPRTPDAVAEVLSSVGLRRLEAERDMQPIDLRGADTDLGALLRARMGDEPVDRLVDPLLSGVYSGGSDGMSLRTVLPNLASALDAQPSSLIEAVATIMPPTSVDTPVFGTLHAGMATLVRRLQILAAAEVYCRMVAREIQLINGRAWSVKLHPLASAEATRELVADAVVLAVPPPAARRLLSSVSTEASGTLAGIQMASTAVVSMAFSPETVVQSSLPSASGMLIAARERAADQRLLDTKAFTFSSNKWPHLAGSDRPVFIRGSLGRFGDVETLQVDDDELVRRARNDLRDVAGVVGEPIDVAVARWGGALPQYQVGHVQRITQLSDALRAIPRLEITGAAFAGVGIPACIAHATRAAKQVADDLLSAS